MAGNSFGGSIKLTGESDYKKALKDITGDLRLMSSEMKVLATSTDSSGKSSDADRAKKEALSKAIVDQKNRLIELNKQLQASVAENGSSSDSSKRLQTQINNATVQLNKMESQLNGTGKETNRLGGEMDGTGKKASVFGDVLKANLASEALIGGVKLVAGAVKALGSGLVDMVGDGVKAFAEYEQLVGGVETLFKNSSAKVQSYADDAYKNAGLSANDYMAQVTSFSATLLQGLGGDTDKASEFANRAVIDMSDNANKMGTDIALIQNAYQGFAKDNFTMLDNLKLGYGGTQAEMARLINDSGVMGKEFKATAENVKDIPFDKLIDALHKTQENLGITGTTAKEASSTISGSFNSVKASWENVLASFAGGANDEIAEAIDGLIESATNLVTNVTAVLPNIVEGIGQLATGLIEQIPNIITLILPPLMTALQGLINSVVAIVPQLIPVVTQLIMTLVNAIIQNIPMLLKAGIDILLGFVNGIIQAIPTLIPAIVTAIKTIVDTLLANLPAIIQGGILLLVALIQGLADALPTLVAMIPTIITTIIQVLTKPEMIRLLLKASWDIIYALAKGLILSIPEIVKAIPQIIGALIDGVKSAVGEMLNIGGQMVNGLADGFKNGVAKAKDKIIASVKNVLGKVADFLGIHSPSTYMRDQFGRHMASGIGVGFMDEMDSVAKDMNKTIKDSLPTSIDTQIGLNSPSLTSSVADSNTIANATTSENLIGAIQQAFKSVKIELDDKPLGNFIIGTVEGAVF